MTTYLDRCLVSGDPTAGAPTAHENRGPEGFFINGAAVQFKLCGTAKDTTRTENT